MIDLKYWVKAVAILSLLAFTILHVMPAASQENDTIAFVNVNVIPMDEERVLEDQTVIVQGDRIVEIGGVGTVSVPPGAQIIEGNGRYLIPGLTDLNAIEKGYEEIGTRAAEIKGYQVTNPYEVSIYPNNLPLKGFSPRNKNLPKDAK